MCFSTNNFSKWLKDELEYRDMTSRKLAKISGIHVNSISNYLHGRCEPTLFNAQCIANAFGYELMLVKKK